MLFVRRTLVCAFVAAVACTTALSNQASAAAVELSSNGGFETGDFTGWTQFGTSPGDQTVINTNPSSGSFHSSTINSQINSNSLFKQANIGIGTVLPNEQVTISFDARGSYAVPGGVAFAEFFSELSGGGVSSAVILSGAPLILDPDSEVWKTFMFTTNTGPDVSGGVTLQLGAVNGPGTATTMFFDNISVSVERVAVPEPGSFAVLAMTGVVAVIRRRRR